jgi:ABC-2 type transport system permease protein
MRSIFRKELASFFSSLVGYVAVGVFLAACWLFLWVLPDTNILDYGYANLDPFFEMAPFFLLLLIPAITMRSFADEFRGGTIEWLSTKPLRDTDIILGKYFASLALVVFALLPTLVYIISISWLAEPKTLLDTGGLIGSYIGLFFLAAAFTAVGVFCSSLTSNQVVGFLVALFACYILYAGFDALSRIRAFAGGADYYLALFGLSAHYGSISRGVVDTRDVIYFISIIIIFLALTRIALARRTWNVGQ